MFTEQFYQQLLDKMPYKPPFLFVDKIIELTDNQIKATFFFDQKLDFYQGHFTHRPITPGVILLECMGQVGCVLMGIYQFKFYENNNKVEHILGLMEGNFYLPVYPNTLVTIESELEYVRGHYISSINHLYNDKMELAAMSRIQCNFQLYE